ncbi:MAG: hypothetical protein EZS28_031978, partial [Streblomastix strix]
SLGIIVFQLLTNVHPFEGRSENDTIERIKRVQYDKLPDWVSSAMRDIVEAMLSFNPSKRPTTQQLMEQETIRVYLDVQEEKERALDENDRIKASILIPSSINRFAPTPIVPVGMLCHSEGTSIVHSEKNKDYCIVTYDPIITNGIMRFEGIFVNCQNWTSLGIVDSSVKFVASKEPWGDDCMNTTYKGKIVRYGGCNGDLFHINVNYGIIGNTTFEDGKTVAMELDLNSDTGKLHFFVEGKEQPISVIGIPASVRFFVQIYGKSSKFVLTKFDRLQKLSTKAINNSLQLEWGKDWDKKQQLNSMKEKEYYLSQRNKK